MIISLFLLWTPNIKKKKDYIIHHDSINKDINIKGMLSYIIEGGYISGSSNDKNSTSIKEIV